MGRSYTQLSGDKRRRIERWLAASPRLHSEAADEYERELVVRPVFAENRAQALSITRADVAAAAALVTDGVSAGTYRERDRLIDIRLRSAAARRLGALIDQLVWSPAVGAYVPLAQVIDGFEVVARETPIERGDRVPTITVQASVIEGVTAPTVFAEIRPAIEEIPLPRGYALESGGEFESAGEAQVSLARQMPLSFGSMLLITVLLFGHLRQTAVIWTIVPMAVTAACSAPSSPACPFSFTALLGLLSLAGMVIENAILPVEEIDAQKAEGLPQFHAIVETSVSRLRPVMPAAATTILGMVPLLTDSFFAAMSVAIMAGLSFASVLTLIGVPVLNHIYLRRERLHETRAADAARTDQPRRAASRKADPLDIAAE